MFNSVFHRYSPYLAGLTVLLLMTVSIPVLAEGEKVQWGMSIEDATNKPLKPVNRL
jgi:hypothetical protein